MGGGHTVAVGLGHARWSAAWGLVGLDISWGQAARRGAVDWRLAHVHMDITDTCDKNKSDFYRIILI